MPSTQDLIKGIDLTGIVGGTPTLSQLDQLVDEGRIGPDMGLCINTIDIALNIPDVPNPNLSQLSVIPTWWTRYAWVRKPFDSTGTVKVYYWNPNRTLDPSYLRWESIAFNNEQLTNRVDALEVSVGTLEGEVSTNSAAIANSQHDITNIQVQLPLFATVLQLNALRALSVPPGSLRWAANAQSYSTAVDQGWLICDGSAVRRDVFINLFSVIGIAFGAGDGNTTFNVPDARGRSLLDDGTGNLLTSRVIAQTGGEESHKLIGLESGIANHQHVIDTAKTVCAYGSAGPLSDLPANGPNIGSRVPGTEFTGNVDAANAHNNMSPYLVARLVIKT